MSLASFIKGLRRGSAVFVPASDISLPFEGSVYHIILTNHQCATSSSRHFACVRDTWGFDLFYTLVLFPLQQQYHPPRAAAAGSAAAAATATVAPPSYEMHAASRAQQPQPQPQQAPNPVTVGHVHQPPPYSASTAPLGVPPAASLVASAMNNTGGGGGGGDVLRNVTRSLEAGEKITELG